MQKRKRRVATTTVWKPRISLLKRLCPTTFVLLAAGMSAHGQTIELETRLIGDPDNPPDTNGLGAVGQAFRLGAFEITNEQYKAFLDAVATIADPHGLYNPLMETSGRGGIIRTGAPGAFVYTIKPHFDNKPVGSVSWFDAARFCNWLHNGQPTGLQDESTTENGAYDMSSPADQIVRKPGAMWFLPTHDEWYKAAYYDPESPGADAGGTPDYWLYPYQTDVVPEQATATATGDVANPGPNVANTEQGAEWNEENGNVTTVGSATSLTPWGVFDMGGNINELTETLDVPIPPNPPDQPDPLPTRTIRGGDFASPSALMASPDAFAVGLNMLAEGANIGFRVASLAAPSPDLNGDGVVDGADLGLLLGQWGGDGPADLNDDGVVDGADLGLLLGQWG